MLTLTDNAVERFKDLIGVEKIKDHGVRIFTTSGGWGPSLAMDIADGANKGDVTIEKGGVKVFLEKEANKLLSEATMDFSSERGIIISGMPRSSCCGWFDKMKWLGKIYV